MKNIFSVLAVLFLASFAEAKSTTVRIETRTEVLSSILQDVSASCSYRDRPPEKYYTAPPPEAEFVIFQRNTVRRYSVRVEQTKNWRGEISVSESYIPGTESVLEQTQKYTKSFVDSRLYDAVYRCEIERLMYKRWIGESVPTSSR